ncbi:MAG: sensor histidine kinase, partial [Deltaproteobacteria bacterium]|nr:sensor histidine kinase [Deltaproteobacteria bacterium]
MDTLQARPSNPANAVRRDPRESTRRHERFVVRAQALFFARVAFLVLGFGVLLVAEWRVAVGATGLGTAAWAVVALGYSVTNYLLVRNQKYGQTFTFATLCLDLVLLVYLISHSGGVRSPVMAAQLVFTIFFALLFPSTTALIPPLLALPVAARVDLMFKADGWTDFFYLFWYAALDAVLVYVMVYLTGREEQQTTEIARLEQELKALAVVEERNRLAREIHDGLGAALSGLIIQAEYAGSISREPAVKAELKELKGAAEEAIDELRRALVMMRNDFQLVPALENVCSTFKARHKLPCDLSLRGNPPRLSNEAQLTIFRILQESLTNISKHANARKVTVSVNFTVDGLTMTVADDGKGFDIRNTPQHHYGLVNMRERARKVGGDVLVESERGQGTTVTLMLHGLNGEATMEAAIPVRYTAHKP